MNKFLFNVKQLKMNKGIKYIWQLIIITSNAILELPSLSPCEKCDSVLITYFLFFYGKFFKENHKRLHFYVIPQSIETNGSETKKFLIPNYLKKTVHNVFTITTNIQGGVL